MANMAAEIVSIKDLRPGMKNVTCVFIVIDRGTTNQTKDGSIVRRCRVADRTGSIFFSLWNEQAEAIEAGDILQLKKGYVSIWKGNLVLYSGKHGILEKIGEFTMVYSELPDMSDPNQEFAIQYQKAQQQNSNGLARGGSSSRPTGGMRMGHGNWNGNNHMGVTTPIREQPILPQAMTLGGPPPNQLHLQTNDPLSAPLPLQVNHRIPPIPNTQDSYPLLPPHIHPNIPRHQFQTHSPRENTGKVARSHMETGARYQPYPRSRPPGTWR